jgi:hypothetical protein
LVARLPPAAQTLVLTYLLRGCLQQQLARLLTLISLRNLPEKTQQSTNRLYEDFTQISTNGHEMENISRITGVAGASHGLDAIVAKKQHHTTECDSSSRGDFVRPQKKGSRSSLF